MTLCLIMSVNQFVCQYVRLYATAGFVMDFFKTCVGNFHYSMLIIPFFVEIR